MPFLAPVDERQQGQKGHGRPLNRQADDFTGEDLQCLVIGQEVPFRFDMGRGQVGVGRKECGFRKE